MSEIDSLFKQDSRPGWLSSSETGLTGERLAAEHLAKLGYRLVVTNFKVPVGRNSKGVQVTGEIDLIALDGETLCFVEVKTRVSRHFGGPLTAVDLRKQRQISRTARVYRRIFNIYDMQYRFDVVSIVLERGTVPEIVLTKSFWTDAKFRKRTWNDEIY